LRSSGCTNPEFPNEEVPRHNDGGAHALRRCCRHRNAYLGWGISLYLLGFLLAWQVARLHDGGLTGS